MNIQNSLLPQLSQRQFTAIAVPMFIVIGFCFVLAAFDTANTPQTGRLKANQTTNARPANNQTLSAVSAAEAGYGGLIAKDNSESTTAAAGASTTYAAPTTSPQVAGSAIGESGSIIAPQTNPDDSVINRPASENNTDELQIIKPLLQKLTQ